MYLTVWQILQELTLYTARFPLPNSTSDATHKLGISPVFDVHIQVGKHPVNV